ncbi:site-2 protease family protein [Botrimarina hoheduenensis]|uniref:Peptidase family M50 n=1 Tax=Botrimarina hoheduenensis TaxID=2528000 RepID=A0A5C5WEC9_9BACT|nr:site-2 protease family protein [Botrimarina hoheduenensis]TWT48837.1 Peptidase family M50 [Botrimarina hoheduenensis]
MTEHDADPTPPARQNPAAAKPASESAPRLSVEVGGELTEKSSRELRASDFDSRISADRQGTPRRRRVRLPLVLFLATCASTFWVGAAEWEPMNPAKMATWSHVATTIASNWRQGLTYMGAVLAILLTHEMGHFIMTLRRRIPASYPLCIPVPFNAIGTMGAVIGMEGVRANRREIFDIGIAGPLAGLVIAAPILWIGVGKLDLTTPPRPGEIQLNSPLLVKWMIQAQQPETLRKVGTNRAEWIGISQVNAFFMAGWVGMLVTGLNMLPISQLDGGHTIYGLFGRDAQNVARGFLVVAITYVVINLDQASVWTPMLVLVILMGVDHPPTSDDTKELDRFRWAIGVASLAIPVLCFPLLGLRQ